MYTLYINVYIWFGIVKYFSYTNTSVCLHAYKWDNFLEYIINSHRKTILIWMETSIEIDKPKGKGIIITYIVTVGNWHFKLLDDCLNIH